MVKRGISMVHLCLRQNTGKSERKYRIVRIQPMTLVPVSQNSKSTHDESLLIRACQIQLAEILLIVILVFRKGLISTFYLVATVELKVLSALSRMLAKSLIRISVLIRRLVVIHPLEYPNYGVDCMPVRNFSQCLLMMAYREALYGSATSVELIRP
ncbi:unnamed protein product [Ixodes pacificus]